MKYLILAAFAALTLGCLTAFNCGGPKLTPEGQRATEQETQVPGMEEALEVKDRTIRIAIVTAIKMDVELVQNNIEVEVSRGKVILTGKVPTEEMKARAEKYARQTEAVQDVLNKIEVDPSLKEEQFSLDDA